VGKPERKSTHRRPKHGWIILRWIFRKWGYRLDRAGSGKGQVAGTCEHGNEPSDSKEIS